jgi:hypothetical protein
MQFNDSIEERQNLVPKNTLLDQWNSLQSIEGKLSQNNKKAGQALITTKKTPP